MKYLLKIAYLGTSYSGYQVQKNANTVQGELCRAALEVFGTECDVTGCSRTDSGVHANEFYCTLEPKDKACLIPPYGLPYAMNQILPCDISVLSAEEAEDGFHPRYSAKYKEYEYLIYNGEQRNPFYEGRALFFAKKLDTKVMNKAAAELCGEHDFTSFTAKDTDVENKVRTILYCDVSREGDIVKIRIAANGFLYNMVRIIVGTLIGVSCGNYKVEDIKTIIESKDRSKAGYTASPCGLYLNKVVY